MNMQKFSVKYLKTLLKNTTWSYYLMPITVAKIKNSRNSTWKGGLDKREHSSIASVVANWYNHTETQSSNSSKN